MPENLKLLKRVPTLFEAHAIRGHLDSHGITCSIPDEMTGSTQPHLLLHLVILELWFTAIILMKQSLYSESSMRSIIKIQKMILS